MVLGFGIGFGLVLGYCFWLHVCLKQLPVSFFGEGLINVWSSLGAWLLPKTAIGLSQPPGRLPTTQLLTLKNVFVFAAKQDLSIKLFRSQEASKPKQCYRCLYKWLVL